VLDLPKIVAATEGFSGAEIEQVVIAALYRALYLKRPLDIDLIIDEVMARYVPVMNPRVVGVDLPCTGESVGPLWSAPRP